MSDYTYQVPLWPTDNNHIIMPDYATPGGTKFSDFRSLLIFKIAMSKTVHQLYELVSPVIHHRFSVLRYVDSRFQTSYLWTKLETFNSVTSELSPKVSQV